MEPSHARPDVHRSHHGARSSPHAGYPMGSANGVGGRDRPRGGTAVPGLPAPVPASPGGLRRRVDRAAGVGHAAWQPPAARMGHVGRVVLVDRAHAVRRAGGAVRAQPQRDPYRRGDDLHPADPARRVPGPGPGRRPGRRRPGAGRGGHHAGPGAALERDLADHPRSPRQRRPRAAGLAGRRAPAVAPGGRAGLGSLLRAGRGGPAAGLGAGGRWPDPAHRRGPDGLRVRCARLGHGAARGRASRRPGRLPRPHSGRIALAGCSPGRGRDLRRGDRAGGRGGHPAERRLRAEASRHPVRRAAGHAAPRQADRRGPAGHLRRRLLRPAFPRRPGLRRTAPDRGRRGRGGVRRCPSAG